jgi:hypothetical protein
LSLSRLRRLSHARWIATSDDEHAVSTTSAGPCAPRKYANRPAAKFDALPNGMCGSICARGNLLAKVSE